MTLQQLLYEEDDFSSWKKVSTDSRGYDHFQKKPFVVRSKTAFVSSKTDRKSVPIVLYEKLKNDKLHSQNGPAVRYLIKNGNGYELCDEYHLHGIQVPKQIFDNFNKEQSGRKAKLSLIKMFFLYYLGYYFLKKEYALSLFLYHFLNSLGFVLAYLVFHHTDSFLGWVFGTFFLFTTIFNGHDKIKSIEKWETVYPV